VTRLRSLGRFGYAHYMRRNPLSALLALSLVALGALGFALQPSAKLPDAPKVEAVDFTKLGLYEVVSVTDGDTVHVRPADQPTAAQQTIRLVGVDTPETKDPRKEVQAYGKEASEYLTNLLKGERVWLQEGDSRKTDKYGRTLAYLYRYPDGLFVNLELVRNGYGVPLTDYPFKHLETFRAYGSRAALAQKGLYGLLPPKPPEPSKKPQEESVTVYGTKTGTKYHSVGCSNLSQSSIPMTLEQAKAKGLAPCSKCNPPH
jgi:micrococcal nuclease